MKPIIVVGVDGNEPALKAARTAAQLAADTGASLHVVCAYSRDQTTASDPASNSTVVLPLAEDAANTAADTARILSEIVGTVTSAAIQARPADALISEAERLDARIIVVGNKRVQGIARVLGSVAGAVAHNAPCDVYVAHTN